MGGRLPLIKRKEHDRSKQARLLEHSNHLASKKIYTALYNNMVPPEIGKKSGRFTLSLIQRLSPKVLRIAPV